MPGRGLEHVENGGVACLRHSIGVPQMSSNHRQRIVLDALGMQGAHGRRGIGTYTRGLVSGLLRAGLGPELGLLLDGGEPMPELPAETGVVVYSVRRRYRGRLASWEDAALLGRELEGIRPRLYHALTLQLPGRAPCPVVATVHDLIPWAFGGPALRGDRLRYGIGRRRLRRVADRVVAVSGSTAADLRLYARVPEERIRVVHEGVDPAFRRIEGARGRRWGIEKPFLLYVGALDVRKSPGALLRAWASAQAAGADCELVLAGAAGAQAPTEMGGARRLGHLPVEELAELLSAASCLLFPSRYEGFGLPVLEAMACGCPVATYDNSSLPEVAGDVGALVEDGDAEALGRAAARFLLEPELAAAARSAGRARAASFTWDRAAAETAAVYQELME